MTALQKDKFNPENVIHIGIDHSILALIIT